MTRLCSVCSRPFRVNSGPQKRCVECIANAPYHAQRLWQFNQKPSYRVVSSDQPTPLVVERVLAHASPAVLAVDAIARNEAADALLMAIRQLSPRMQTVLALRYGEELSLAEVGERLGCTGENVRLIEMRALRALQYRAPDLIAAYRGVEPPPLPVAPVRAVPVEIAERPFVRVVGLQEPVRREHPLHRDLHPNMPVHRMRERVRSIVDAVARRDEDVPLWRARKTGMSLPRSFPTVAIEEHW